jgi:hypothetical protein
MRTLRVVVALHALGIVTQAILAGLFLSGATEPVAWHERTAWVVVAIAAVQIVLAFVQRAGLPLAITSVFLFVAEALQTGTGYGRFLGVHIPLGVLLFGAVMWQLFEVFRSKGTA